MALLFFPFIHSKEMRADGGFFFIHPRTWQVIKIIKQKIFFFSAAPRSLFSPSGSCIGTEDVYEKKW